ncbi:MAG: hypothetical protein ACI8ZB_001638 [Desulforhopalus sp.]|jgi:hypothetical protein
MKTGLKIFFLAITAIALTTVPYTNCFAEEGYAGWEKDSTYNKLYNNKERDSLKGELLKFTKITPLQGMTPGTALILQEGDEKIIVHLCPWDYAAPEQTGLRKGVKTKLKGAWAVIDDKDIFMASKVKQGEDFEFKVRLTKDGTPFWTMSPEELALEQSKK